MSNDKVEAVERALAVLNAFRADRPRMTLGELAAATGFYKSTILRLAASLERCGYLVREDNGGFRLGPTLWRLGSIYRAGFNLGAAIRPELRRLVETTGETASFYIREGRSRVCLFRLLRVPRRARPAGRRHRSSCFRSRRAVQGRARRLGPDRTIPRTGAPGRTRTVVGIGGSAAEHASSERLTFAALDQREGQKRQRRSAMIARAALWPGAPVTPPPG
jgi:hypothetical protein